MLETKIWPVEEMVHEDEFTDRIELLRELASVAWVPVGWIEARPDAGFGHGLSRAETHHLRGGHR